MHDDEVDISADLVRKLVADQFPLLRDQPVTEFESTGTVNAPSTGWVASCTSGCPVLSGGGRGACTRNLEGQAYEREIAEQVAAVEPSAQASDFLNG
jgi:hypothetical protein